MDWTFKSARLGSDGKVELGELLPEQENRSSAYRRALIAAVESSVPRPKFSNYYVREGIASDGLPAVPAGNIEYGFCLALHGEESAVSALRSACGREGGGVVLAIAAQAPGNLPSPCGNCRDIMLDELGRDAEIVCGAKSGGVAVVLPLGLYLFDDPKLVMRRIERNGAAPDFSPRISFMKEVLGDFRCFDEDVEQTIDAASFYENDFYSPADVHPERKYGALLHMENGERHFGALDVMCDYHPIYPLRDAIREAYRENRKGYFIKHVVVVGRDCGRPPQVMYKDRQHLLEFNLYGELLLGEELDPPVYLATYKNEYDVAFVWKTSVKQWLPLPFTARNFMDLNKMSEYYERRGRL